MGITSVATSDYEYLTEELESLQTVLDIVNQLNLDGDTNGEQVAAKHVTNDYATDAAQAKAAYHGATINESNSQGRAGEGSNPTATSTAEPAGACAQYPLRYKDHPHCAFFLSKFGRDKSKMCSASAHINESNSQSYRSRCATTCCGI